MKNLEVAASRLGGFSPRFSWNEALEKHGSDYKSYT